MKTNTTNNMKKLTLLILLFTGLANAQIVNIPDANFKAKLLASDVTNQTAKNLSLVFFKIDSNNDGQIQQSEALQVSFLDISSSNISSLTGISSFTNLRFLYCPDNSLTTINITSNLQLDNLNCNNNLLSNLNVNSNSILTHLSCRQNQLIGLNLNNNNALTFLDCSQNLLTSLNVNSNNLLQTLWCSNNSMFNLNVSNNISLQSLSCSFNQLTVLNVSNNSVIAILDCYNNQLTNLNVSSNLQLQSLSCQNNFLSILDVSNNLALNFLECFSNQFTSLNLSNNISLGYLLCQNNLLTSLFIKNGKNESTLNFSNNSNLQFICADDTQLTDVQTKINTYGYTSTCSVSSYCSFTPGGNYNTITGNIKFDANNNGCDVADLPQPNIRVNINDGTITGANFTNNTGNYTFFTQAGSFVLTPDIENPSYFTFSPTTSTIPFANNNNNTATQDFCISPIGFHPDLEVVVSPYGVARPGFDAQYYVTYKNKGNQQLSGAVNLLFDDAKTDFISANPAVDNLAVNSLSWNYNNLLPFEARSILVTLNVNSPTETPAVTIGDILNFTTSITPVVGDDLPLDNTFMYNQTVVGSFDPNNIECLEGTSVAPSEIGKYLHYAINFENTGNFPAENVVVKTTIDPVKFDINSLQLLDTSSPVDARITGNVVEFIFKNVQLAGPGGHGHVLLKVKSKNSLIAGDTVANRADIFFDYNAPVDTGLETTIFQSLSNSVFAKDDSINVSPNPSTGNVTVRSNFNIKSIELYDVQGRILQTVLNASKLDISDKSNGIYFLKITTEKGSKIEKIIKE
jgi:Leucine-rich repeat (LRR) protein